MFNQRPITAIRVFTAEAIATAGTVTSGAIALTEIAQNYKFAILYTVAGTGTVKIDYLLAVEKNGNYTAAAEIVAAAASGGVTAVSSLTPALAPWMKIKLTENNVNPITALDLWLIVQ